AGQSQTFPVGGKSDRVNRPRQPARGAEFLATGEVPKPGPAKAGTGQDLAVGRKCDPLIPFRPGFEGAELSGRGNLPEMKLFVLAGRDQAFAIAGEDEGGDLSFMTLELAEFCARGCIPEADDLVLSSRRQPFAV